MNDGHELAALTCHHRPCVQDQTCKPRALDNTCATESVDVLCCVNGLTEQGMTSCCSQAESSIRQRRGNNHKKDKRKGGRNASPSLTLAAVHCLIGSVIAHPLIENCLHRTLDLPQNTFREDLCLLVLKSASNRKQQRQYTWREQQWQLLMKRYRLSICRLRNTRLGELPSRAWALESGLAQWRGRHCTCSPCFSRGLIASSSVRRTG